MYFYNSKPNYTQKKSPKFHYQNKKVQKLFKFASRKMSQNRKGGK